MGISLLDPVKFLLQKYNKKTFSDIWDAFILKNVFVVYLKFKFHWAPRVLSGNPRPGESEHRAAPSSPMSIPRPQDAGRWSGDQAARASAAPCWLGSPPQERSPLLAEDCRRASKSATSRSSASPHPASGVCPCPKGISSLDIYKRAECSLPDLDSSNFSD